MKPTTLIKKLDNLKTDNQELKDIIQEVKTIAIEINKLNIKTKALGNLLDFDDVKEWYRMHGGLDKLKDDTAKMAQYYTQGKTSFTSEAAYILHKMKNKII